VDLIQLIFVRLNSLGVSDEALFPFTFTPVSAVFGQDMLRYTFMALATLIWCANFAPVAALLVGYFYKIYRESQFPGHETPIR
jgi:hypothetical protein